jgi:hypothetical protein
VRCSCEFILIGIRQRSRLLLGHVTLMASVCHISIALSQSVLNLYKLLSHYLLEESSFGLLYQARAAIWR